VRSALQYADRVLVDGEHFVLYYLLTSLFATYLQKDLGLSPAPAATPFLLFNLVGFVVMGFWGGLAISWAGAGP
jgi:hypothetical protein